MKMSMRQDSNLRASRCKRDDVATCRYASWIKWRESNSRIFHGKESLCHWATLEFAALLAAVTLVLTGSVVYLHHVTQMANCLDLQWVGWNCQDACNNAIYWIRTNVSSIAASALTTKLNARIVDTNVTLLYASLKSTRSKWPNHYDSLLYQLSYILTCLERTAGLKPATSGFECKMNIAAWILNW